MSRRPAGGTTLARVGNALVVLGLLAGAVVAVVAEYVLVGVAVVVLALVLVPGILYPRYNFLWWAVDLALSWP
jgi:Flp pilus assembly protein protease CpaA